MLHKVQSTAIRSCNQISGFGYIMEQGLGKTLTYAHEFLTLVQEGKVKRSVVICPNSFKQGWVAEINKWGLGIDAFVFKSAEPSAAYRWVRGNHNQPPMLIVNYEAIRQEWVQELIREFVKDRTSSICADESVQISTWNADQTKAAIRLAKLFQYRRILSGKWMKKGPHDLWSQLRFLGLIEGTNYFAWRTRYCKMGGWQGRQVIGAINQDQLAGIIQPFIFQALKKDWTDLPDKIYTKRYYKLGNLQGEFDRMMEDFIAYLNDGQAVSVEAAITKYIKLAQIQTGFLIDEGGKVHELVPDKKNPRLQVLLEFIENEVQGKVAIPFQHKHSYEVLSRALASYRPAYIRGGMAGEEIEAQKRRFNNDPDCRVILLQTRASKYGHTLLGEQSSDIEACSTMAFYENTYSFDDRVQIEDRIHRHGQHRSVTYVDLIGTEIDEKMIDALNRREDIYQSIMGFVRRTEASGDNLQSEKRLAHG